MQNLTTDIKNIIALIYKVYYGWELEKISRGFIHPQPEGELWIDCINGNPIKEKDGKGIVLINCFAKERLLNVLCANANYRWGIIINPIDTQNLDVAVYRAESN